MTTTRWHGWHGWLATVAEVGLVTAALLPVAVLLAWALARSRAAAGVAPARARLRSVADVGLVYGTVPWVWLTMVPGSMAGLVPGRVSLVPLRDLVTMSTGQVVGNLGCAFALSAHAQGQGFQALQHHPGIEGA